MAKCTGCFVQSCTYTTAKCSSQTPYYYSSYTKSTTECKGCYNMSPTNGCYANCP